MYKSSSNLIWNVVTYSKTWPVNGVPDTTCLKVAKAKEISLTVGWLCAGKEYKGILGLLMAKGKERGMDGTLQSQSSPEHYET